MLTPVLLFAQTSPEILCIAPNTGVPGESLTVQISMDPLKDSLVESDVSFGNGIRIESIERQARQLRRRGVTTFVDVRINIDAMTTAGPRHVSVKDITGGSVAVFYVTASPQSPTFRTSSSVPTDLNPTHLSIGNLDSDPLPDLVAAVTHVRADGFLILLHNGTRERYPIYVQDRQSLASARATVIADYDGDGDNDLGILATAQVDVFNTKFILGLNTGKQGTFKFKSAQGLQDSSPTAIATGDFDQDGLPETVIADGDGDLRVYSSALEEIVFIKTLDGISELFVGDWNRDRRLDIVAITAGYSGNAPEGAVVYIKGNGDGTFKNPRVFRILKGLKTVFGIRAGTGDFDNDGIPEIAVTTNDSMAVQLIRFEKGRFQPARRIKVPCALPFTADLNNDTQVDLICLNDSTDTATYFPGTGSLSFKTRTTFITPRYPISIAAADWNGDGKTDLAIGSGRAYLPVPVKRPRITYLHQN